MFTRFEQSLFFFKKTTFYPNENFYLKFQKQIDVTIDLFFVSSTITATTFFLKKNFFPRKPFYNSILDFSLILKFTTSEQSTLECKCILIFKTPHKSKIYMFFVPKIPGINSLPFIFWSFKFVHMRAVNIRKWEHSHTYYYVHTHCVLNISKFI